jgi:hypothetical protein
VSASMLLEIFRVPDQRKKMKSQESAKPSSSDDKKNIKVEFLIQVFKFVNYLGVLLKFIDKAWEWFEKHRGDYF